MSNERNYVLRRRGEDGEWQYYSWERVQVLKYYSEFSPWVDVITDGTLMTEGDAGALKYELEKQGREKPGFSGELEVFNCAPEATSAPLDLTMPTSSNEEATSGYALPGGSRTSTPHPKAVMPLVDAHILRGTDPNGNRSYYGKDGEWTDDIYAATQMDKATARRLALCFKGDTDKTLAAIRPPGGERAWVEREVNKTFDSIRSDLSRLSTLYERVLDGELNSPD